MKKKPTAAPIDEPVPTPEPRPALLVYDDAVARDFEPFALTRPIGTLLVGTAQVWERWQTALQIGCAGLIAAEHLSEFDEAPGVVSGTLPAGTILANSRFAPALEVIPWRDSPDADDRHEHADARAGSWVAEGRVAAVRLSRALPVADFASGSITLESLANAAQPAAPISGWWHDAVWDFLKHLPAVLTDDINRTRNHRFLKARIDAHWPVPTHVTVIGDHAVVVQGTTPGVEHVPPALIEQHVVLDATAGPILIESGVHVHAFSRITGPCRIGRGSTILGGDITGCSIGPVSKIRGEISGSIVLGYSNKGHEGFVGSSYLGRWVNLGAGTTTSNLKNTYGEVSLWTPRGIRPTGMQFLGTLFGDHVKTGIGTLLTTGTVLGAAANVYGAAMPPKAVAPFSWGEGEPYDTYRLDKFLASTEIVMGRRKVPLSARAKRQLSASFEKRWTVDRPATGKGGRKPT
jgi:UDP-N-acetylglucosamine diphosphorylase/glucosamine-1-phosphate N-acetyltransferase